MKREENVLSAFNLQNNFKMKLKNAEYYLLEIHLLNENI